jgi:hypothetical protein
LIKEILLPPLLIPKEYINESLRETFSVNASNLENPDPLNKLNIREFKAC